MQVPPTGGSAGRGSSWYPGRLLPRLSPYQLVAVAFLLLITVGTALLMLPMAKSGPGGANLQQALFTATSATCVVGLGVVDTGTYWTPFGQAVVLALIQIGGLGIMAGASLIGIAVSRRLGLRTQLMAAEETRTVAVADVRRVVLGVTVISLAFEAVVAAVLTVRFATGYDIGWAQATWDGIFHAVSAFNNAGFSLFADGLGQFVADPWVCLPVDIAVILGGLGFPVLWEIFRERRRAPLRRLTANTQVVLWMSGALLLSGTVLFWLFERSNPQTLGPLGPMGQAVASFTQSVMPRSAGLSSIDFSAVVPATQLLTIILMFVGGATASTAGGIKVGTAAVAGASVWAQMRGDDEPVLAGRTVPVEAVRQAYALIALFAATLLLGVLAVLALSDLEVGAALFETTSALTTTGLTTGVTSTLPDPALLVLTALMYVGRLGPVSLGAALALRERRRLFRYPEGRPNVG